MELDSIIKEIINPVFKQLGFKKKSQNFFRTTYDLTQVFNVQKSQWNSKNDLAFTFNIGFFNTEIFQKTWDRPIPNLPKEYDCFLSLRSGFITHNSDFWYKLNQTTSYDQLSIEIRKDLSKSAIDLFEKYQTLISLNGLFKDHPDLIQLIGTIPRFVFLMKIGSEKEAVDFLTTEYREAHIPKSSVSVINYPDGSSIETKSEPRINQANIDSLIKIAKTYNIDFK